MIKMDDFENNSNGNGQESKMNAYTVYKWRWFLLATLMVLNISNAMAWLTFGPVAYKASEFYDTTLDMINLLSVVFMITGIPCGIAATWLLDTVGLRLSVILSAWLNCIGCVLRVISALDTVSKPARLPLVFVGQSIAALAQPFMLFAPTKLAALWFPVDQRATANMLATIANPLGIMITGIVSPILTTEKTDMPFMLGVQCIPAGVAAVMATFGWCRSKPRTPPSVSAETESQPFWGGVKMLATNWRYVLLAWTVGAGIALFSVSTTLLSQILCPWGYDDYFAGVVCISAMVGAGFVGAAIAGVIVDRTKKFTEITKLGFTVGVAALVVLAVMQNKRDQQGVIAAMCGVFGFFGIPVYPIGNELAVETTYPVGEATSSGVIFMIGQLQGIVLVILMSSIATPIQGPAVNQTACKSENLGQITVQDMSVPCYVMVGYAAAVLLAYLIFFRTDYKRLIQERPLVGATPGRKVEGMSPSSSSSDDTVHSLPQASPAAAAGVM